MSELRQNCLTGDWVVVALERAKRPHSYVREPRAADMGAARDCPFCVGNESLTPPELFALRPEGGAPDRPGWRVRVVPNKFPAFTPDAVTGPADALRPALPGTGAHEVIVHGPDHDKSLGQMNSEDIARIFSAYQRRLRAAEEADSAAAVVIVNHGAEAGASISHPHSQLFALPLVPVSFHRELRRFNKHWDGHGTCLLCDLADSEKNTGDRVVAENDEFLAFCPFASRVPFEIYLVPKKHSPEFNAADAATLRGAAEIMRLALSRILTGLGDVPYNIYLHTRPFRSDGPYHWHFAILPKTSIIAGFEFASGMMINAVAPESAAEFLRLP